jgi:hypothetical protein
VTAAASSPRPPPVPVLAAVRHSSFPLVIPHRRSPAQPRVWASSRSSLPAQIDSARPRSARPRPSRIGIGSCCCSEGLLAGNRPGEARSIELLLAPADEIDDSCASAGSGSAGFGRLSPRLPRPALPFRRPVPFWPRFFRNSSVPLQFGSAQCSVRRICAGLG